MRSNGSFKNRVTNKLFIDNTHTYKQDFALNNPHEQDMKQGQFLSGV